MKKIATTLLSAILIAGLFAGCGEKKEESDQVKASPFEPIKRKRDVIRHDNDVPMDALDDLPGS